MRRVCRSEACSGPSNKSHRLTHRAVVMVELVLMLPVLLVFLAALVEFGLMLANTKVVALASRSGAKIAAETQTLPFNIAAVKNEVNAVLATAGMQACTVILEHNVPAGGTSPLTVIDSPCNCSAPTTPSLPVTNGGTLYAVRVTVCVELSQLTPDLLTTFGFSTANRTVSESTLYPHEH